MSSHTFQRGDVVLVSIPYLKGTAAVRRPALVVCDPTIMLDIVIAAISSRIRDPLPQTHYVIDQGHHDWTASGLRLPSVVRCDRLFTVDGSDIQHGIGSLSDQTMEEIGDTLKLALGIA
jgi:mRNA interferase MazF